MKKYQITFIFFLLHISLCFGLSLEKAKQLAEKNNKELKATFFEIKRIKHAYLSAVGRLYPQISLTGKLGSSKYHFPEPVPEDSPSEKKETMLVGKAELTQILFTGGKYLSGVVVAKKAYNALEKKYELKRQEIIYKTTELYYQLILAQKSLEIQMEALELVKQNLSQTNNMFNQGLVSEYQLLRAKLEKTKIKNNIVEGKSKVIIAKQALSNLIGEKDSNPTDSLVAPKIEIFSLDNSIELGKKNRIELFLSQINIDIDKKKLEITKKEFIPNFALSASYQKYSTNDKFSVETNNFGDVYEVGITFHLPLVTGFSKLHNIAGARNKLLTSGIEHESLEQQIALQIKNAYYEIKKSEENYTANKQNVELADKAYEIAKARYSTGISNQLELFDAQFQKNSARLQFENSVYKLTMATIIYKKAIGEKL